MARPFKQNTRTVSVISTTISIFLVLLLFGFLEVFLINARYLAKYTKENIVLRMMFRESAKEAEVAKIHSRLRSFPYTKSAEVISRKDAKELMAADMGEGYEAFIGVNPFPFSIDFTLHEEYAKVDSIDQIVVYFEQNELIREVYYPPVVVERIETNFKLIAWVLGSIALAFLVIAITLINSTVRLTIYSKRFLVKSMQLVGATRSFIRRPFIWQSIGNGLLAAVVACMFILGLLYLIQDFNPDINLIGQPMAVILLFSSIIGLGFMITAISSYFAVNRYLDLKLEELY